MENHRDKLGELLTKVCTPSTNIRHYTTSHESGLANAIRRYGGKQLELRSDVNEVRAERPEEIWRRNSCTIVLLPMTRRTGVNPTSFKIGKANKQ